MNSRPLLLLFSVILNDPLLLLFFCHSECSDSETKNLAEAATFFAFCNLVGAVLIAWLSF